LDAYVPQADAIAHAPRWWALAHALGACIVLFVSRLERIDRGATDLVAEEAEHEALCGARSLFALCQRNRKGTVREVAGQAVKVIDGLLDAEAKRRSNPGLGESFADLIKNIGVRNLCIARGTGKDVKQIYPSQPDTSVTTTEAFLRDGDPSADTLLQSLGLLESGQAISDFSLIDTVDINSMTGWPPSSWIL